MQQNENTISHIGARLAPAPTILTLPRRSYAQLQQALVLAEAVTERTLLQLLAQQQSQLYDLAARPDTTQMQHQLHNMIKQAQRHATGFAVLFVQLDDYAGIFQRHGAAIARQVSELTLARLAAVVRDCDVVCQQADDQFLLLITDVKRIYDVVLVAEKLLQKLGVLHGLCAQPLILTASIGVSRYPQDGNDARLLTERAAAALLHAQHRGGNQFSLLR